MVSPSSQPPLLFNMLLLPVYAGDAVAVAGCRALVLFLSALVQPLLVADDTVCREREIQSHS